MRKCFTGKSRFAVIPRKILFFLLLIFFKKSIGISHNKRDQIRLVLFIIWTLAQTPSIFTVIFMEVYSNIVILIKTILCKKKKFSFKVIVIAAVSGALL